MDESHRIPGTLSVASRQVLQQPASMAGREGRVKGGFCGVENLVGDQRPLVAFLCPLNFVEVAVGAQVEELVGGDRTGGVDEGGERGARRNDGEVAVGVFSEARGLPGWWGGLRGIELPDGVVCSDIEELR